MQLFPAKGKIKTSDPRTVHVVLKKAALSHEGGMPKERAHSKQTEIISLCLRNG